MEKSVFTNDYKTFLAVLRDTRKAAKVTQEELATRIGQTQSFISKCERGESRLDVLQLRGICRALGTSLPAFVNRLEARLVRKRP